MINVEIKAKTSPEQNERIRKWLIENNAYSVGIDHQVDTYFNAPNGRLKVRQGNIENALIAYARDNVSGPKLSKYYLSRLNVQHVKEVCDALTISLGVLAVVDKYREIFYVDNVKIHLDNVVNLGFFVEIEARDEKEELGIERLNAQTEQFIKDFELDTNNFISVSYSDMILEKADEELNNCTN